MHEEIERKFLVKNDLWRNKVEPILYRQGYIARTLDRVARVRIAGDKGVLSIKIKTGQITRLEFEYEVPLDEAISMLNTLNPLEIIEKKRYIFQECGHTWEVDEFLGANEGLIVAEVELSSEDEEIIFPEWIGEEVSRLSKYLNVQLATHPYSAWADAVANSVQSPKKK